MSVQYSFLENKVRPRISADYTTNGENEKSINIYGAKFGCDLDIIDKLILTFSSSIRFNNTIEKIENIEDNGETEIELVENWSMNSSGLNLTLGYRF